MFHQTFSADICLVQPPRGIFFFFSLLSFSVFVRGVGVKSNSHSGKATSSAPADIDTFGPTNWPQLGVVELERAVAFPVLTWFKVGKYTRLFPKVTSHRCVKKHRRSVSIFCRRSSPTRRGSKKREALLGVMIVENVIQDVLRSGGSNFSRSQPKNILENTFFATLLVNNAYVNYAVKSWWFLGKVKVSKFMKIRHNLRRKSKFQVTEWHLKSPVKVS